MFYWCLIVALLGWDVFVLGWDVFVLGWDDFVLLLGVAVVMVSVHYRTVIAWASKGERVF